MNPVTPSDIVPTVEYERTRDAFRREVMATKAARRVHVGEHLTLLFENRTTVRYQVQEMMRTENIVDPRAIKHELDTYNELVPAEDSLSATLLIEYTDERERDAKLRELCGLEDCVTLSVRGSGSCRARFDQRQMSPERISAVHYVHFSLGRELADAMRGGATAQIQVTHPALEASTTLDAPQAAALAQDLGA